MTANAGRSRTTTKPSWQRWSNRAENPAQGHIFTTTHDCGWSKAVNIHENSHAIPEAQHAHEREGCTPDAASDWTPCEHRVLCDDGCCCVLCGDSPSA